jgi:hypothetical protein
MPPALVLRIVPAVAADFLPAENEALDLAEGRAAGSGGEEAQDERWWH